MHLGFPAWVWGRHCQAGPLGGFSAQTIAVNRLAARAFLGWNREDFFRSRSGLVVFFSPAARRHASLYGRYGTCPSQ
jgi:hypothetical protein